MTKKKNCLFGDSIADIYNKKKNTTFLRKNASSKEVYRSFWPNIMSPGIKVKTRNSLNVSRTKFDVQDFCTYQTLFLSRRFRFFTSALVLPCITFFLKCPKQR